MGFFPTAERGCMGFPFLPLFIFKSMIFSFFFNVNK
jgi:hypothetical protein